MRNYVFLYKENNTDDRDCVKYVEIDRIGKLECGHFFPSINTTGSSFSKGLKIEEIDFNNITTILTEEEFKQLDDYNKNINELGYGIEKGDERYQKGIELYNNIKPVIEKLKSEENQQLFLQVQEEEREFLNERYSLDDEDIDYIFDSYHLPYRDRAVVGHVFNNIEDMAIEEADALGYTTGENEIVARYFDYEKFGRDLLDGDRYLELPNGRCVMLMY